MSKEKCWVFVDKDGTEKISNSEPMRRQFKGKRIVGNRFPELTLVDLPLMDDKVEIPLKSNVRLKQENDDLCNFVQV